MFVRDQAMIQKFAEQSPKNTAAVAVFVISSIRTRLIRLPIIMAKFRKHGYIGLGELMPKQKEGCAYVLQNKDWLFHIVEKHKYEELTDSELLLEFMRIPCIGLVKAGFLMQCLTGKVGCLDCHNLREYSIPESAFKMAHNRYTTANLVKVAKYVDTCEDIGGSEHLWNQWCEGMAKRYPTVFDSADSVSWLHTDAILGVGTFPTK